MNATLRALAQGLRRTADAVQSALTWVLVMLVRVYQVVISPLLGPRCRFYPSCSSYALQALRVHGPLRGVALAGWRLLRCNPWNAGGIDPVPPRRPRARFLHGHEHSLNERRGA
jgi:putative membrane protein insertion efficiency factor